MNLIYNALIISALLYSYNAEDTIKSPCPRTFVFEPTKSVEDRWFGLIKFVSDRNFDGLTMELHFNKPVIQLGNFLGKVTSERDNRIFWINANERSFAANRKYREEIFVVYDPYFDDPPPALERIFLNGRQICPSVEEHRAIGNIDGPSVTVTINDPLCGRTMVTSTPLIHYGSHTVEGKWPWHVAIYREENGTNKYTCGGSLITDKYVLSAAHCVTHQGEPLKPNQLEVILGKYGLYFTSKNEQKKDIIKVIVHPDFNRITLFNDISILQLKKPATFTIGVKPICLWTEDLDIRTVVSRIGIAPGWGRDEHGSTVTDLLMEVNMPLVDRNDCYKKKPEFYPLFMDDNKFCAGFANGTSVCNGDSGGGLVFRKPGTTWPNEIWQIRGIVSNTVGRNGVCDPNYYAIFTDVAKYLSWIQRSIRDT